MISIAALAEAAVGVATIASGFPFDARSFALTDLTPEYTNHPPAPKTASTSTTAVMMIVFRNALDFFLTGGWAAAAAPRRWPGAGAAVLCRVANPAGAAGDGGAGAAGAAGVTAR